MSPLLVDVRILKRRFPGKYDHIERGLVQVDPADLRGGSHKAAGAQGPGSHKAADSQGPGSQLKSLLAKFGIHATPNCKCNSMAKKMDAWGPDESLNHLEEIVDVMQETAEKRGLPFLRTAAKLLVRRAISKSRAMISKGPQ
jgi:hypothetical protein